MLNAIRMDLYRMFHMKSFWVMTIIIIVSIYFTTTMLKTDLTPGDNSDLQRSDHGIAMTYTEEAESNPDKIEDDVEDTRPSFGIVVDDEGMTYDNAPVWEIYHSNVSGCFTALLMLIFVVLFAGADFKSGYIKNIGGQVQNRGILILSKSVCLVVWDLLCMALFVGVQAVSNALIFGEVIWGDLTIYVPYAAVQTLLHFALSVFILTVVMLVRNTTFSMTFSALICMGITNIACHLLNKHIIHPHISKDIDSYFYTITGKISMLSPGFTSKDGLSAIIVAVVFLVLMTGINLVSTAKRDLV